MRLVRVRFIRRQNISHSDGYRRTSRVVPNHVRVRRGSQPIGEAVYVPSVFPTLAKENSDDPQISAVLHSVCADVSQSGIGENFA